MTKMKERLKVSWLDHQLNLVETITDLHYKNVFCDVTIACDGQYFTAHKLILCAQSDYFRELLEMAPCRHPFIILRDTTSEVFESLMQFIYKGNVEVPRERVPALMKAGSDMKIKGLFSPGIDNDEHGAEQGTHQPPQTVFSTITGEKSVSKTPGSRDQLKGTFDRSKNLSQESYSAEDSDDSHGMMDTANEIGSPSSSPQPKAKKSGRTGKMKRSIYVSDNLTETSRISKLPNIVIEPCSEGTPMAKRHKPSSPEEIENAGEDDAESPEVAEVECVPTFNIPLSHNVKVEPGQSYEKKSAHDTQDDCNSSDRSIHSGEPLVEERGAEDGMDQNAQFQSSVAPGGIRTDISKEDLKMEEAFLDFPPEMDLVFDVNEDESKPGSIDTHTPHPSHKPPRDLSLPSTSSSNNKPVTDAGESSVPTADEFMEALLCANGLDIYVQKFKEHEIDKNIFLSLKKENVVKLIPKIGHQIRILNLISHLKDNPDIYDFTSSINSPETPGPSHNRRELQLGVADIKEEVIREKLKHNNFKLYKKLQDVTYCPTLLDKRAVSRVVTNWLCTETKGYPSKAHKRRLAEVLLLTYPSLKSRKDESIDLWYQESAKKGRAGGLIEVRCLNWRKRLCDEDRRYVRKNKPAKETTITEYSDSDMNKLKFWCMEFDTPANVLQQKMRDSYPLRQREATSMPVKDVFIHWPRLRSEDFIRMDFSLLVSKTGGDADGFITKFPLKARQLLYECMLQSYVSGYFENKDQVTTAAILALPKLLPRGNYQIKTDGKTKHIRPSYGSALASFIAFYPEETNVSQICEENTALKHPLITVLGSEENMTQIYLIIGDDFIQCNSLLSAVNCLFQAYWIFDLKYPPDIKNVFLYLEKDFYNLGPSCILPTCVLTLSDKIN